MERKTYKDEGVDDRLLLNVAFLFLGFLGSLSGLILVIVALFSKTFRKKGLIAGFASLLVCASLFGVGVYNIFFNLQNVPTGDLLKTSTSPTGAYTLRIYVSDGGATVDYTVRGEIQYNDQPGWPKKTIYWNYHESTANVRWADAQTVVINGHTLNVLHDTYDFRRS